MCIKLIDFRGVCLVAVSVCLVFAILFSYPLTLADDIDDMYAQTSAGADTGCVIIIDAGHGGEDCGAIGVNGVFEKDINLSLSFLLGEELCARGYTVVFTRTEDKLLYKPSENIKGIRKISDLKNRCEIVSRYNNAILISIHMNSFGTEKYSGLQVYYSSSTQGSRLLAERIQDTVRCNLQPDNNRRVKSGEGIYILENVNADAVLIECGFLSNKAECDKLSQKEYQKQLSFQIVCGIIEYIQSK